MSESQMVKTRISEIVIYPIKGCRGQVLSSAKVTEMGIVGDREFTLLLGGQRANQKQVPLLHNLSAEWQENNQLILNYPGEAEFILDGRSGEPVAPVEIYSKLVPVLDMGEQVSTWLSRVLKAKVNLVRMVKPVEWFFPLKEFSSVHEKDQSKFIDAAPILLTNQNSLDDLNHKIDNNDGEVQNAAPLLMNRFRANIVVSGLDAYAEDNLPEFEFPSLKLNRVAVCERCTVTTTDQETGLMAKEPLRTLSKYRKRQDDYAGGIMFGIYLTAEVKGSISVGDELTLL